jgi:hypothetical protein
MEPHKNKATWYPSLLNTMSWMIIFKRFHEILSDIVFTFWQFFGRKYLNKTFWWIPYRTHTIWRFDRNYGLLCTMLRVWTAPLQGLLDVGTFHGNLTRVTKSLPRQIGIHVIYKVRKLAYRIWVILIANERVKKKAKPDKQNFHGNQQSQ